MGKRPIQPSHRNGKLYGRGSADDGYAAYASIAAIATLKAQNIPHPRMVGLIETCEESGSGDLLPYIDALRARLGELVTQPVSVGMPDLTAAMAALQAYVQLREAGPAPTEALPDAIVEDPQP